MNSTDPRHNSRRIALASLFCWLFSDPDHTECELMSKELLELENAEYDKVMIDQIINGIKDKRKEIDEIITTCAPDWPIDKISKIDLITLRIAIYELLYKDDVPEKVVIDEAVEISKEFGAETSSKFVNGVLGTVLKMKTLTKQERN